MLLAVATFCLAPGVLGESSFLRSMVALAIWILVCLAVEPDRLCDVDPWRVLALVCIPMLVCMTLLMWSPDFLFVGTGYPAVVCVVLLLQARTVLFAEMALGMVTLALWAVLSYLVSFATGFSMEVARLTLGNRDLHVYFP